MSDADRTPDEIRNWLAEIVDMTADIPDPAMITGPIKPEGTRPVPSSRPPTRLDVLSLLTRAERYDDIWETGMQYVDPDGAGILPYLWGWVRDIEATLYESYPTVPDEAPETPTVTNCADWLGCHAEAAATTHQWSELVYGLRKLRSGLRAATAGVRDVERKPVPCSRCGQPLHRVGEQALWECEAGHQTSVEAVTLRQAHERLVADGGQWVPSMSTLKDWSRRPGLLPCLRESERVSLYDLSTIRKLVAEARVRSA